MMTLSLLPSLSPLQVPREGSDTADPYAKLYLLPDPSKSTKMKTKISKKTLNPTYNETVRSHTYIHTYIV